MPHSLVVFDLGNVLVRIARGWAHAFELARVTDVTFPTDTATAARLHELICMTEVGKMTSDAFCRGVSAVVNVPADRIRAALDACNIEPFEGARDLLTDLATRGVRTACLSNTQDAHWAALNRPPFPLDLLTYRFASQELGLRKPDRAIYAEVDRRTGTRPADGVLFFDDLPENVEAARQHGWSADLVAVGENPIPWLRTRLEAVGAL